MYENMKNNAKGRVIWTYRLMERETLQEIWRKTTKKSLWSLVESEREKKFWKSGLSKSNLIFFKTWFTSFDWSKISFDWSKQIEASLKIVKQFQNNFDWSKNRLDQSKQTEAPLNILKHFRLIEKHIKSIEVDRGSKCF